MSASRAALNYHDQQFTFESGLPDDHILGVIARTGQFYEQDVLSCLLSRFKATGRASGAAVDAGAYLGTHSVFFGKAIGLSPVVSFEANPETVPMLRANLARNGMDNRSIVVNRAVGSGPGWIQVVEGPDSNRGMTRVDQSTVAGEGVEVVAIDTALAELKIGDVALLKIDVEGAELAVLDGALTTLRRCKPVLCIEIHDAASLRSALSRLEPIGYTIIDCLGYSPTYVLDVVPALPSWRRRLSHKLWLMRAGLNGQAGGAAYYLKRLGQLLSRPD